MAGTESGGARGKAVADRRHLRRLPTAVQAAGDAVGQIDRDLRVGEIDWSISVDSTVMRTHQHVAGARTLVQGVRAWAARAAGAPASST
ncbi:hypothetical protein GCM10011579_082760 [Streptomyces albiflavescens]|uniref:Transposase n=1 Tax=Streptomyces albiflavescens TaxID=1623582 RepID=A0A918D9A8_9ACTN|nr:hypothetical protein GCM10011579_082760 [Streptomyces albiflavescens]